MSAPPMMLSDLFRLYPADHHFDSITLPGITQTMIQAQRCDCLRIP